MADREKILRYFKAGGDEELAAKLLDLAEGARKSKKFRITDFLDPHSYNIAEIVAANYENIKIEADGGFNNAERVKAAFIDENGNATSAFNPAIFTKGTEEVETGKGKLPCVVLLKSSDCAFTKGDYLWAIPRNQINLNSNLVQNPGY